MTTYFDGMADMLGHQQIMLLVGLGDGAERVMVDAIKAAGCTWNEAVALYKWKLVSVRDDKNFLAFIQITPLGQALLKCKTVKKLVGGAGIEPAGRGIG